MQYGRYKRFEENKKKLIFITMTSAPSCAVSCHSSSIAGATALRRDILYMYPVGPETSYICSSVPCFTDKTAANTPGKSSA